MPPAILAISRFSAPYCVLAVVVVVAAATTAASRGLIVALPKERNRVACLHYRVLCRCCY